MRSTVTPNLSECFPYRRRRRRIGKSWRLKFQENDPDHYELIENVLSNVGVRTGYFYAKRDRLYVGVPAHGSESAQVWTYEAED
jgi:hypothetical protein